MYSYAKNKYPQLADDPKYRWSNLLFRNVKYYILFGLIFALFVNRGPWGEIIESFTGIVLDEILFNSLGMMAGIISINSLSIGTQVIATLLIGFAVQHVYLDSKIWRVSKDKALRRHLKMDNV